MMNDLVVKLVLLRIRLTGVIKIKVVSDTAIDVCDRLKFKLEVEVGVRGGCFRSLLLAIFYIPSRHNEHTLHYQI